MVRSSVQKVKDEDIITRTQSYLQTKGGVRNISNSKNNRANIKGVNTILDALSLRGIIDPDKFNAIKFESLNTGKSFDEILVNQGILNWDDIASMYSEMRGVGYISLRDIDIPLEILNKIPKSVAKSSEAISFEEDEYSVKVGMRDPLDLQKIKYIEAVIGKPVKALYASIEQINQIIDTRYGAQIDKEVGEALEEAGRDNLVNLNRNFQQNEVEGDIENAPIIKIVNMILDYGINYKASDVHIEPRENKVSVRFRVSGILSEKLSIPRKLLSAVVTRIKILCNAKIDEHRVPQDGRFQVKSGDNITDIRVSIMPGIYGEKIVMRLLEKKQSIRSLNELGMNGSALLRLEQSLRKTQGVILVTGPTGSGKTQTLSSCLKILNSPEVNIVTLEDPVEIRIDGINQVQVNSEVGLTFASGLRSFLRQDPDIIMVGEIRDAETASLAIQAALVGRLVLATIHTNSAAGAFVRLTDMGIEPFLLSSTVNLVVAQRLVRVLCECKKEEKATLEQVEELHKELDILGPFTIYNNDGSIRTKFDKSTQDVTLFKPVGCSKCNQSGFLGRIGIFESLQMSDAISGLINGKNPISDINKVAIKEGMITLIQDGYLKALRGTTTIEEVIRVKNE